MLVTLWSQGQSVPYGDDGLGFDKVLGAQNLAAVWAGRHARASGGIRRHLNHTSAPDVAPPSASTFLWDPSWRLLSCFAATIKSCVRACVSARARGVGVVGEALMAMRP